MNKVKKYWQDRFIRHMRGLWNPLNKIKSAKLLVSEKENKNEKIR